MRDDREPRPEDDQALSALIDGELEPEAAQHLRRRLEREPHLARRYEALRGVDRRLREALMQGDHEPMPAGVLELLQPRRADPSPPAASSGVVPMRRPPRRRFLEPPAAIAAGIALAVGFVLAQLLPSPSHTPAPPTAGASLGPVDPAAPLHAVLDATASSETVELEPGVAATPRFSFRHVDGGYCRVVDFDHPSQASRALACRTPDSWRIEMASLGHAAATPAAGLFEPAEDTFGPMERALDAVQDGPALGAAEEQQLLRDGWSR